MAIFKNNHHPIFGILISDHGVVKRLLLFLLALPSATAQTEAEAPSPPPPDPYGTITQRFDPSMAIIMVVVVSVFFLLGFFSVYIRQCAQRQFGHRRNTADPYAIIPSGHNRRSCRVARGLEAYVINTFPTFVYSAVKGLKIGKDCLECAVCLNEFEDDETLRLIPKCSHVFHPDCIDVWLASHTTCPVCRANLVPDPGETISSDNVQVFDPHSNSGEPEQGSDNIEENSLVDVETADAISSNENMPARTRSTGWRLASFFTRSESTGDSLVQAGENSEVQAGENSERFTLRLPEEVRSQLMTKSSLNRSISCVAFPRVRSSRRGFRSASGGLGVPRNYYYYERFNQSEKSDPTTATPPKSLFKSVL